MFSKFLHTTLGFSSESQSQPQTQPKKNSDIHHAQRILELEMLCQSPQASSTLLSELVQLYADAFQFYERQGSEKCMIYQKRMHHFLSKQSIESLMKGQNGHLVVVKEMVDRKTQHAIYTSREDAQRIISKSLKKAEKERKRIDKQLTDQQKKLDARIQRRRSMSNKSSKSDNEDTCDDLFGKNDISPQCNFVFDGFKERHAKRVFI